jgi:hypothetical protein
MATLLPDDGLVDGLLDEGEEGFKVVEDGARAVLVHDCLAQQALVAACEFDVYSITHRSLPLLTHYARYRPAQSCSPIVVVCHHRVRVAGFSD